MDSELLINVFGLCALINIALIALWFALFTLKRDLIHKVHTRWFQLSEQQFDAIQYQAIAFYKIVNTLLFIVPWLALTVLK
ncbi:DUF6868 family protein [Parendozoicomonas haliclonae]|uniref:DUF6868 domain-containing protein n=1 Tax=Parendozoicomonas haliclonae TaxID=1960125 RepID=A0A1X7AJA6_9GAMM|nr:hypothetical protein [Parendozoicomonas haliclonae]SMA46342.1 hypothetical protein EHSB41UT_02149 [Parendozoicomonas haliclonae]